MIKLQYSNNVVRETKIVSEDDIISAVLDDVGFDYSRGVTSLNGVALTADELNQTFAEMGCVERAFITNVEKLANA